MIQIIWIRSSSLIILRFRFYGFTISNFTVYSFDFLNTRFWFGGFTIMIFSIFSFDFSIHGSGLTILGFWFRNIIVLIFTIPIFWLNDFHLPFCLFWFFLFHSSNCTVQIIRIHDLALAVLRLISRFYNSSFVVLVFSNSQLWLFQFHSSDFMVQIFSTNVLIWRFYNFNFTVL